MKTKTNPTTRTHEKILEFLRRNPDRLYTINFISERLGFNWFSVSSSIDFLSSLGVIEVHNSNGQTKLVRLKKEVKNGITI